MAWALSFISPAPKVTLAPVEFMPLAAFEDQLQVNLVGAMRVTQVREVHTSVE